MNWEYIGECGSGKMPADKDWILKCLEMGIVYLEFVIGSPPQGSKLGIMWNENESGSYPSIGILWDFILGDVPWDYINQCESALTLFNNAVDWSEIEPDTITEKLEDEDYDYAEDDAMLIYK